MRPPLLAAALWVVSGCSAPEAPPALVLPLLVDDAPAGEIVLPDGPGPWALDAHLPEGAPPVDAWRRLSVEGAGGRVFSRKDPGARAHFEEPRFYRRQGKLAFAVFLVVDEDAPQAVKLRSREPSLAVADPLVVRVRTRPLEARSALPKLGTSVDGRSTGRFRAEELAGIERVAEPKRPQHVTAMRLADLVALRVPLDRVAEVTLVARDRRIRIPGDELKTGLRLMKPTKRGAWAYKRFEGHERAETARGVSEVQIALR